MPIEIICNQCETRLRVGDSAAGRKARCPKCSTILQVPGQSPASTLVGASQPKSPPRPVSENPFARPQKESADQYNVDKQNPYAAPSSQPKPTDEPGKIDPGTVFSFTWQVFTDNLGLLLGVAATLGVITVLDNILDAIIENTNDDGLVLMCIGGSLILWLLSMFLGIGQARIALKLCRGQRTGYHELFQGGDRFLKVLGWAFLIMVPLILGFVLLIIPGLFLLAIYWPTYYLIADRKTGVFGSFAVGQKLGLENLGSSFLLLVSSLGIFILGLLACGIGLLFSSAYLTVLWATAYLMMTGEIRAGALSPHHR